MKLAVENGITSLVLRVFIQDSASTTGAGKTGLTSSSTGMIIALIADNEATATLYTVAASNVETITTLGTFAAPTASKCRFKEVDATNLPGVYELHFANARWSVSSARSVQGMISGASGAVACPFEVQLANVPANVTAYASGQAPLQPTTAGRTLDVTAAGNAGIDWANIENPTASNSFSGSYIALQNNQNVLLADGAIKATTFAANSITASALAADAATEIGAATLTALGTGTWATALPWNAAWDAEVQSGCADAITAAGVMTGTYTAPDNASILEIKSKTENLPPDPADQSLIIAATDAVISRIGSPAGASVSADIASVKTDTGNLVTRIPSALFSGITSLADWIRRISRKDAGTDGMTTAQTEINTGGTSTFTGTTDSLEAIADASGGGGAGDALEATSQEILTAVEEVQTDVNAIRTSLGVTASATPRPNGYVDGLTEPLIIGDDYTSGVGRLLEFDLVDANGDPADVAFGSKTLADAGISIQMLLKPSGKSTGTATLVGTCTYVAAPDAESPATLQVSLPRTQTAIAVPGSYDLQVEAKWSDNSVVTFLPYGKVTFEKDIRRPA